MFDSQVLAFTAVAALLTVTPGSDTLLVIRNTLRGGRSAGWITMTGILCGLLVHALFSAVGLSVVLAKSAAAFHAVKLAGAAYLVWLGVQTVLSSRRAGAIGNAASGEPVAAASTTAAPRAGFTEGLLTNVLNPKVAVFYLAFLPQFISPGDPVLAKSVLLASIHALEGVLWLGGIAVVVARSRRFLRHPSVERWLLRASGTILAGLGIRLALESRS